MRSTLAITLTAAFALVAPSSALATDRFVDKDMGTDAGPNNCLSQASPCATINYALGLSGPGDTVKVDDSLTPYLEGPDLGAGESLVGFEFIGGDEGTGADVADVDINPTAAIDHVFVMGPANTISGLRFNTATAEDAISMDAGASVTTITGNTFVIGTGSGGIRLDQGGTTTVSNNAFRSASQTDDDLGIVATGGTTVIVEDNTFSDFRAPIVIGSTTGSPNSTVRRNQITGVQSVIGVTPSVASGIEVHNSASVVIEENEMSAPIGSFAFGITVGPFGAGSPTSATLLRNQIYDHRVGVSVADTTSLTMTGDVIGGSTVTGVSSGDSATAGSGDINLQHVTVAGAGSPIELGANFLTLDKSIVSNAITDPSTTADCAITSSRGPTTSGSNCQTFQTNNTVSFVNTSLDDYRLQPGPANAGLIDALPAEPGVFDFDGDERNEDGDGDCMGLADMGADEALPTPPTAMFTDGPSEGSTITTNSTSFSFSKSTACPGSAFQCSLDGAGFSTCTSPANLTSLSNGTHTFQVRAVDLVPQSGPTTARNFNVAVPVTATPTPTPPVKKCKKGQKLKKGKCVKKKRKKKK